MWWLRMNLRGNSLLYHQTTSSFAWQEYGSKDKEINQLIFCPGNYAALNEALRQEVDRLRVATGEISTTSDTFNLTMQHLPYNQTTFFSNQPQAGSNESQNIQMQQFHTLAASMSNHQHPMLSSAHAQGLPDSMHQDPLGRFQGLDISSRGTHVKSEGPSISASESSSTFWFRFFFSDFSKAWKSVCLLVHRLTPCLTSRIISNPHFFIIFSHLTGRFRFPLVL